MQVRVFLASFEDIRQWGSRPETLINTIEPSDILFLINNNVKLNTSKEKMLDSIKEKAEVHISDAEGNNTAITGQNLLVNFLKKKSGNDYRIYIIGPSMKCIFDDKQELETYAHEVFYHHNFQVKKIKTKTEETSDQINLSEFLGNIAKVQEESTPDTNKEKQPSKNKIKKEHGKTLSSENAETIEREVFGHTIEKKEYVEFHTDLQNAKATLVYELEKRIKLHIQVMLFQRNDTITLTKNQLYNFILIILKTDSADKFNESWSASETDPKIELRDNTFSKIKEEVNYYNAICELLYGEDIWDY